MANVMHTNAQAAAKTSIATISVADMYSTARRLHDVLPTSDHSMSLHLRHAYGLSVLQETINHINRFIFENVQFLIKFVCIIHSFITPKITVITEKNCINTIEETVVHLVFKDQGESLKPREI